MLERIRIRKTDDMWAKAHIHEGMLFIKIKAKKHVVDENAVMEMTTVDEYDNVFDISKYEVDVYNGDDAVEINFRPKGEKRIVDIPNRN